MAQADAVAADPAVLDGDILPDHLRDPQVADGPGRRLYGIAGRRLPRFAADADHLSDAIDALRHRSPFLPGAWPSRWQALAGKDCATFRGRSGRVPARWDGAGRFPACPVRAFRPRTGAGASRPIAAT